MTEPPKRPGRKLKDPALGYRVQKNPRFPESYWGVILDPNFEPALKKMAVYPAFKSLVIELAAHYEEPPA